MRRAFFTLKHTLRVGGFFLDSETSLHPRKRQNDTKKSPSGNKNAKMAPKTPKSPNVFFLHRRRGFVVGAKHCFYRIYRDALHRVWRIYRLIAFFSDSPHWMGGVNVAKHAPDLRLPSGEFVYMCKCRKKRRDFRRAKFEPPPNSAPNKCADCVEITFVRATATSTTAPLTNTTHRKWSWFRTG